MTDSLLPDFRQRLDRLNRVVLLVLISAVVAAPLWIVNQTATAAAITTRSVAISTAQASATATYTFTLNLPTSGPVAGIFFQSCTTALGSCTAPSGINLSGGTVGQSGWTDSTAFAKDTSTSSPACNVTSNLCVKRTSSTSESGSRTITDTGVVNPSGGSCATVNCTFFIRITTYSNNTFATSVDTGTVAASTSQLFTVNAAIQETLTFCIGATTIDDENTTTPPLCSSVSGTSLNLGVLDSGHINVSPVSSGAANGDGNNGIAELSTNAVNGTSVAYKAVQQSGTNHQGTLRVVGATCNVSTINTDQCIDAQGTTQGTLTAGTEKFGLTIAAVNCKATTGYTCAFGSDTYNLRRNSNYDGTGSNTYPTDSGQVTGVSNAGYAWDESGTAATIASSSTVVDKEALILKFAATPNIVTPTGAYTAQADFIATPTF